MKFVDKDFDSYLYINKTDFIKKKRALRTYCPKAHKDLIFINKKGLQYDVDGRYSLDLYTSKEFKFVYGQIKLIYIIKNGNIILEDITPQQFLLDGYSTMLGIYKGIFYRDNRDKFKIDLFKTMKARNYL